VALLGPDFLGGRRKLYRATNPAGPWLAIGFAVALVLLNQLLQSGFALVAVTLFLDGSLENPGDVIKAYLIALFPAAVVTALAAWFLAKVRGGNPVEVLNLHWPKLGPGGWALVILGFLAALYAFIIVLVLALGLDLTQYEPTEGQDNSESIGMVKQAMFDIAHDPRLFLLVLPSVVIGAPLAEEFIFRGQMFAALTQTRLGFTGTTVVTSASWALLHMTEPWLSVASIFVMGLFFGYLLYRFGSIWVTIACHGVWNGIYSMIMFGSAGQ